MTTETNCTGAPTIEHGPPGLLTVHCPSCGLHYTVPDMTGAAS